MSSPTNTWQDRRGMFQSGKEVHEPGRKLSNSFGDPIRRSSIGSDKGLEKTTSSTSNTGGQSPTSQRRRSSNTALFGNLMNQKRGSEDYEQRRTSFGEMQNAGAPGLVSGWYNKTFKGVQPTGQAQQPGAAAGMATGLQKEPKRGVME